MIKKILILIFFIVSSASPLFACETEKIKKKCYSQKEKNMEYLKRIVHLDDGQINKDEQVKNPKYN